MDAPDTLIELHDGGRVEETSFADYGIKTIAGKTYEGVSMRVDRGGDLVGTLPRLAINTKGRYKRMTGVVGILGDAQCTNNDANVSITNGSGERLRGPFRVGADSPKRFNISIRNRTRVTLDQLSLPAGDNPCDGDNIEAYPAYPAWGDLEFLK